MRILVTGAKGFIGKNFIAELSKKKDIQIDAYDIDSKELDTYCARADFVFHLAGANRPTDEKQYTISNVDLTRDLTSLLKKHNNFCPIVYSSSIQAVYDTPYGKSKMAAENLLRAYGKETKAKIYIYRFPNIFGKWCKPNYNSVVATFCNNLARNEPITIHDPNKVLSFVYIDDLIEELIRAFEGNAYEVGEYCEVKTSYPCSIGELERILRSFQQGRKKGILPDMSKDFTKKLYSTYLSYLPQEELILQLEMQLDHRGSFTEFMKEPHMGQISVNISKPGIIKGNHWHNTKVEKFLVVSGKGIIRLRKITSDVVIQYYVSEEKLEVIDIPPGYTHNIENIGDKDLITIIWANECFDINKPDTYYMEV